MPDRKQILAEIKNKVSKDEYAKLQNLVSQSLLEKPRQQLNRIPLLLPLLGTFGFVATLYGFEKLLDRSVLINYPAEMIGIGVIILLITGAAATKL